MRFLTSLLIFSAALSLSLLATSLPAISSIPNRVVVDVNVNLNDNDHHNHRHHNMENRHLGDSETDTDLFPTSSYNTTESAEISDAFSSSLPRSSPTSHSTCPHPSAHAINLRHNYIAKAISNALPNYTGYCLKYVAMAIEAYTGDSGACCCAYLFGPNLLRVGFLEIKSGEAIQDGDVMIIQPVPGHENGHICIWSDKEGQWVSDTVQEGGKANGWAPSDAYVTHNAKRNVYRYCGH